MTNRTRARIAGGLVGSVLVAFAVIWEPGYLIFRQQVSLNYLFVSVLALITAVAGTGLWLSFKARSDPREGTGGAIRTIAALEVVVLLLLWATIFTTGAIQTDEMPSRSGRVLELVPEE